jgi:hypothetical protein
VEEVIAMPQAGEKPLRCFMQTRDDNWRPLIRSVADILALLEKEGLVLIGDLYARGSLLQLGGINGCLARVEGETAETRFAVAIPFMTGFYGRDESGKRWKYTPPWLADAEIETDGAVRLRQHRQVRAVEFDFPVLPYTWTETKRNLTTLFCRYANESGLAFAALGRDLPTDHLDFDGLARIDIFRLGPVLRFISAKWHEISLDIPVPSRETISATLAALSMKGRSRGRNARRRVSAAM